jgi:hypothetical protein
LFIEIVYGILPAFDYLENRLTGNSNSMFKFGPSYLIYKLVQLSNHLTFLKDTLPLTSCAACRNQAVGEKSDLMARLQRDLPTYTAAANGFSIDHGDVGDFT